LGHSKSQYILGGFVLAAALAVILVAILVVIQRIVLGRFHIGISRQDDVVAAQESPGHHRTPVVFTVKAEMVFPQSTFRQSLRHSFAIKIGGFRDFCSDVTASVIVPIFKALGAQMTPEVAVISDAMVMTLLLENS